MREINVKYLISDEEEKRLQKITEAYREQGLILSEDELFAGIMVYGSKYDVDKKMSFHERKLGLLTDREANK